MPRPLPLSGLALALLLAACARPAPPRPAPPPPASRIEAPPPAPRWQAVPAIADGAAVPGGRRHIVKPGETGIAIARAYGGPWGRIAEANRIARDAVRAAADGQVIYVGDAISGFGLMVLLRHGPPGPDAIVTAYGHLADSLVQRGETVQRGQPIARAGRSGAVAEPQLLFQIRQGRRAIDPRPHLRG